MSVSFPQFAWGSPMHKLGDGHTWFIHIQTRDFIFIFFGSQYLGRSGKGMDG